MLESTGTGTSTGTVKWFDAKKACGAILMDGGGEIFVHANHLDRDEIKFLKQGQRVTFEITEGKRIPQATNVKPAD